MGLSIEQKIIINKIKFEEIKQKTEETEEKITKRKEKELIQWKLLSIFIKNIKIQKLWAIESQKFHSIKPIKNNIRARSRTLQILLTKIFKRIKYEWRTVKIVFQ